MPDAVRLLLWARFFVFEDDALVVFGHRDAPEYAGLRPSVHFEAVQIDGRFRVLHRGGAPGVVLQVGGAARIGFRGVFVCIRRQVYFRARDMQKTQRASGGKGAGFFRIDHVVGHGRHFRRLVGKGTERAKRVKNRHEGCCKAGIVRKTIRRNFGNAWLFCRETAANMRIEQHLGPGVRLFTNT